MHCKVWFRIQQRAWVRAIRVTSPSLHPVQMYAPHLHLPHVRVEVVVARSSRLMRRAPIFIMECYVPHVMGCNHMYPTSHIYTESVHVVTFVVFIEGSNLGDALQSDLTTGDGTPLSQLPSSPVTYYYVEDYCFDDDDPGHTLPKVTTLLLLCLSPLHMRRWVPVVYISDSIYSFLLFSDSCSPVNGSLRSKLLHVYPSFTYVPCW